MESAKEKVKRFLKWSEQYTKTDMTYIATGGFWLLINKAGLFVASLITMVVFGNWLPQETYGTYQYIISAAAIAGIFSLDGINVSIIKSIAQGNEGTLARGTKEKFRWALLGTIGLILGAGWYFIQGDMLLATGFLIAGLLMPAEKIFSIFKNYWSGKKQFRTRATYSLASTFLSLFALVPVVYFTNDVLIILATFFISHIIFDGIFYLRTQHHVANNTVDETAISFGKNMSVINGITTIANHVDKIIVWHFLGPIQVAIYSFAWLPISKLRGLLPIGDLALPKLGMSKIAGERKQGVISKFLRLFILFIPVGIGLVLIAPFAYQLFFPQYMESVIYFQALSSLVVIGGPFQLLASALVSETKTKALYITNGIATASKIILFLALIPFYGIWGMVFSLVISEIIRGGTLIYFFKKL